ncbi:MAG: vWA domain-containing protein, partial [Anaerolineae bacterium]|nr:vWA domain-containing protein [Anaerolineae bacterium]
MRFSTPLALLLLLTLPYFVWLARPRLARARWRDLGSVAVRLLILLLLTLSLAGAQMVRAADELAVVFLVDASDSMSAEQLAAAESYVQEAVASMGRTDQAGVVLFGANALVERPLSGLAELAPFRSAPLRLQTDMAGAIRLGMALFPAGSARRLVILSDGVATSGDTLQAARLAAAAGITIDYVPLTRSGAEAEAMLIAVE